jgi:FtsH-binding integral membrane protein
MAIGPQNRTVTRTVESGAIDEGLRAYMLSVYNYMASALALTGVVAYATANTALKDLFFTASPAGYSANLLGFIVMIAPLGLVFFFSFKIASMRSSTAQVVFWVFAGLMGLSLSSILLNYTGASVARVFFITAATFGAMSLYGYTTKRDLTGWGSFLFMGLIGVILASIVNIFLASPALYFAISVIGVLIFVGLTAYDTQKIKEMYLESDGNEVMTKKAIMGALKLYLDFINLFIMLIRLFGVRR